MLRIKSLLMIRIQHLRSVKNTKVIRTLMPRDTKKNLVPPYLRGFLRREELRAREGNAVVLDLLHEGGNLTRWLNASD